MNLKKKFVIGAASVALVASMGGVPAMAANTVALPGYVNALGRLGGIDRVQTSLAVADHEFAARTTNKATNLYIASASDANMIDAAAAGMLQDGPIVFVYNNSYVASAVGQHFANKSGGYSDLSKVTAIGGTGAVSDATIKAVADEIGVKPTGRLGGEDRYGTSVAIAEEIYKAAQQGKYKDGNGESIIDSNTNLMLAYLANGADTHVVDSMVGGVLDNGPVLLSQPDGKIPEVVAEFIKKTLPVQFAALGGEGAVADSTVTEAWVIKTLKNDWTTSPSVPNLKNKVDSLDHLVNGAGNFTSDIYTPGAANWEGLTRSNRRAGELQSSWNGGVVTKAKAEINDQISKLAASTAPTAPKTLAAWKTGIDGKAVASITDANQKAAATELVNLYGDLITTAPGNSTIKWEAIESSFKVEDRNNPSTATKADDTVIGFDYDKFQTLNQSYKTQVKDAIKDLEAAWAAGAGVNTPGLGTPVTDPVAVASQNANDVTSTSGTDSTAAPKGYLAGRLGAAPAVSSAAVAEVATYVKAKVSDLLTAKQTELDEANQMLRNELNKIAPKTELRLGGADRYETSAMIANQYAKIYGKTLAGATAKDFTEVYVANATRMPDALTAGQLTAGPILLVNYEGDLPKFTDYAARHMVQWTSQPNLAVYAIGEKGVVTDEQLKKVVAAIDAGKPAPQATPATPLSVTDTDTSVSQAAVEAGTGDITAVLTINGYTAGVAAGITYSATVSGVTAVSGGNETVALGTPAISSAGVVTATVTKGGSASAVGDSFVITITATRAGEVVNSYTKKITLTA